jgi:hypothetical protein
MQKTVFQPPWHLARQQVRDSWLDQLVKSSPQYRPERAVIAPFARQTEGFL